MTALYIVPDANGSGKIVQANMVYDPDGVNYDKLLNDRGLKFVKEIGAKDHASHDHYMIDMKTMTRKERPIMPVAINKTIIKCGDKDSALFTNIPNGVRYAIAAAGCLIYPTNGQSDLLDADQLEISIPIPMTYRVTLNLWPFKPFIADIQAIA